MANVGSSISKITSIPVSGVSSISITNHTTSGTPGTETSIPITGTVVYILVRCRDNTTTLQYTFTSGESGSKFVTIKRTAVRNITGLKLVDPTIFVQADKASKIVEVEVGLE